MNALLCCCTHFVEYAAADHVKWAFACLVKIECDLCIDTNAEVIVHVHFSVWQPIHVDSSHRLILNVD